MGAKTRWRILFPAALLTGLSAVFLLGWKVTRTPEWTVLTGSVAERQVICRSVYRKSARRAAWCLKRLLADPAPDVRLPALEALARRPDLHERFAETVDALARGDNAFVRARSIEYLFQRRGTLPPALLDQAWQDLQEERFRDQHPELLALCITCDLERGDPRPVGRLLDLLAETPAADCGTFRSMLRYPDLLRPFRTGFVDALEHSEGDAHDLLVAALTAIDGHMRGQRARDWRIHTATPEAQHRDAAALDRFTVEAEWAHRIVPNFLVDDVEGERVLYLGEGAGGDHFWRRHQYSTVDIGKAFYTFALSRDDRYQLWVRCWFTDKCGNHSLLHIDDRWLQWQRAGYEDQNDPLRVWHWKRLETNIPLAAGKHTLRLTAGDDGLLYDRLAILPADASFDPEHPPTMTALFDPAVPSSVSLTPRWQAQCRGTTQPLTVWVRRNTEDIRAGTVEVTVPPPFLVVGPSKADVSFTPGYPLARAQFMVRAPDRAAGGEVMVAGTFTANGRQIATGTMILGLHYDWYTTGPLAPDTPLCQALLRKQELSATDLAGGWHPYPLSGYDRLRRLNPELAYGQRHNAYIFLYTDIEVAADGTYTSFLTLDDNGYVFIDGNRIIGRREGGVGEGWMLVEPTPLKAGRHRVFAWVYQADVPEPEGPDAGRHSPNHWTFKWLLRDARHTPAASVRGVPVDLDAPSATDPDAL